MGEARGVLTAQQATGSDLRGSDRSRVVCGFPAGEPCEATVVGE